MPTNMPQYKDEYQRLFDTCVIKESKYSGGVALKADGKAGRMTSDAYFSIAGKYLKGDKGNKIVKCFYALT